MTSAIISQFPIATPPQITNGSFYGPLVSHRFGWVYSSAVGSDMTLCGWRKHDAWPNGNELVAKNLTAMGFPNGPAIQQGWTLTYNQEYVAHCSGSSNSAGVVFLRQRDLSYVITAGAIGSDLSPTPSYPSSRMRAPSNMVAINVKGVDYVVCSTIVESHEINMASPTGVVGNIGTMTQTRAVLGALPDGSADHAYAIGFNSSSTNNPVSLYLVNFGSISKIKDIQPSDVDPTWSHIDTVMGIAIDQTDGNLLCWMEDLTDVVTHAAYFMKLNATTGAIMWQLVLPGVSDGGGFSANDLQQALITQGKFYMVCTNATVAVIDTIHGVVLENPAFANGGLSANHPNQISEDVTGSIYFMGGWSEGTTHPNYFGTYMGPPGNNHTVGNAPLRYFPDTSAPNPPTPAIAASSRARAWTFVLDNHRFYVLDLGTQGTLLYDTTTGSWSQFVTTGYFNWNFRYGTMWNQRIVGGDTDTPQIWEMSPSSMMDNGVTPIVHITTGGLVKRTRTYTSQAALRLAVSTGQLDENGATVLLEFSDDQGETWVQMDTKTLVEGSFSDELAWQGLGAFAAPGRIFRITDIGGFVRIDGCDGELDDFDEDGNEQSRDEGS